MGSPTVSAPSVRGPRETPAADPELNGLTIAACAERLGISQADVWAKLRRGELIGRTEAGRLMIYQNPDAAPPRPAGRAGAFARFRAGIAGDAGGPDLPPLPDDPDQRPGAFAGGRGGDHWLVQRDHAGGGTELALLLDHLSLAKEENREILRMSQESIRKVTELSETIVSMKDTVIAAKDTMIDALKEQVDSRDRELRKLKQQMADLEMLAQMLGAEAGTK